MSEWILPETVKRAMCRAYDAAMHAELIATTRDGCTGEPLALDEHAEVAGLNAAAPLVIASYLRWCQSAENDFAMQLWLDIHIRQLDPSGAAT